MPIAALLHTSKVDHFVANLNPNPKAKSDGTAFVPKEQLIPFKSYLRSELKITTGSVTHFIKSLPVEKHV